MSEKIGNHIPLVSIGMPVYNGEKYIKEALDSLLAQTFTDFELIISDNCSTDNTLKICKEYANRDSRITYITQETNLGANSNFEFVLRKAVGEFFMWAACDDRWKIDFLEKTVNVLLSDTKYGLVFSNYIVRNLHTGAETFHTVRSSESTNNICNFTQRSLNMCPSLIYGLYRLKLVKNTSFETFDFADVHFISQISLKTKIRIVDEYLYIAGTKGERMPYSANGKRISRVVFFKKQCNLVIKSFVFPINFLLLLFVCLLMTYRKIRLWRY